jgi:hypothetical protein
MPATIFVWHFPTFAAPAGWLGHGRRCPSEGGVIAFPQRWQIDGLVAQPLLYSSAHRAEVIRTVTRLPERTK